jgi:succinyl-CoA synthetase beta subunit
VPGLPEYRSKELLAAAGFSVPRGATATTAEQARDVAASLGVPVVVKAQIQTTGRKSLGGILFARDASEAGDAARHMFAEGVGSFPVDRVLVEEQLNVAAEYYAGVIVNDSYTVKGPVLMFSASGGTGVEEIASGDPGRLSSLAVNILSGPAAADVEGMVARQGIEGAPGRHLRDALLTLYQVFRKFDALSIEINPLIVTDKGKLYAADCRLVVDEASMSRHPEFGLDFPRDFGREPTDLERIAWAAEKDDFRGTGFFAQLAMSFKPCERVIGFHGLGGGGAMLSADALIRCGLRLADYSDTSGNPTGSKVYRIAKIILAQPNIDGYAVMGPGIANQDQWHTALGVVRALREELPKKPGFPVVVLLAGNKEAESLEILREGLEDVGTRVAIYGHEYLSRLDEVGENLRAMIDEYNTEREDCHG